MELKRIGVLSCGKLLGALYAVMGLIIGAFMSLFSLIGVIAAQQQKGDEIAAVLVGVGAILFLPVLYGVMGFVAGIITAFVYNLVAGVVGGLEFDLIPRA